VPSFWQIAAASRSGWFLHCIMLPPRPTFYPNERRRSRGGFGSLSLHILGLVQRGPSQFDRATRSVVKSSAMFTETITPRFGDSDGLRHVNNTVIPGWFEQARNPIYRIFNPEFVFEAWNLILARYEIDFVRPLVINGDVTVKTWVSRIGTSSFEVSQEAVQGDALCTRGTTVLVHYDFSAARPVPIPVAIRGLLSEHLAGPDGPRGRRESDSTRGGGCTP
jgi:acyl-CoA thioester hydrolase